jgi:hypothetical protein
MVLPLAAQNLSFLYRRLWRFRAQEGSSRAENRTDEAPSLVDLGESW